MADRDHKSGPVVQVRRWRFGVFEADAATGELRRSGVRVKIHTQPFALLVMLLERPGELVTREEIAAALWPDGTFVDFEQGVNSAVGRIREALGDKATSPRYVETLARRGYRFVAPVVAEQGTGSREQGTGERETAEVAEVAQRAGDDGFAVLSTEADLPRDAHGMARVLFVLLQVMYVGFYVGALANLAEINELMAPLRHPQVVFDVMVATAAVMVAPRLFLVSVALFRAPDGRGKYLKLWPGLLLADLLWAFAPFLLLHHINAGVATACMVPLVYAPFAQRGLVLMGALRDARCEMRDTR